MQHPVAAIGTSALAVLALGLAISGGPVIFALLVMIAIPLIIFGLLTSVRRAGSEHSHFAPPRKPPE